MLVRSQPYLFQPEHSEWPTPKDFFDRLNKEFRFTLDAAANAGNAKTDKWYGVDHDGLSMPWPGVVWCNPPYGREIGLWIRKGFESAKEGATVVMLLPVRTSAPYFHDYCLRGEIRFVKGRLSFGETNAPFDSMIVIFRPGRLLEGDCAPFIGQSIGRAVE
jgi:phage N-6-adenine-methyltransferase